MSENPLQEWLDGKEPTFDRHDMAHVRQEAYNDALRDALYALDEGADLRRGLAIAFSVIFTIFAGFLVYRILTDGPNQGFGSLLWLLAIIIGLIACIAIAIFLTFHMKRLDKAHEALSSERSTPDDTLRFLR